MEETIEAVNHALDKMPASDLEKEYPLIILGKPTSYEFYLINLLGHLDYHLGQVSYHRRLLSNNGAE